MIQQTLKQDLPEGFQRAEFLLSKGMLDDVVPRLELKERLASYIGFLRGGVPTVGETAEGLPRAAAL